MELFTMCGISSRIIFRYIKFFSDLCKYLIMYEQYHPSSLPKCCRIESELILFFPLHLFDMAGHFLSYMGLVVFPSLRTLWN